MDQPVSWMLARDLAGAGHDAVHVKDLGLAAADDPEIVTVAREQGRIVVTQDLGFSRLVMLSGQTRPSIILLRMRSGKPGPQSRALFAALTASSDALATGAIVVVEDASVRVHTL